MKAYKLISISIFLVFLVLLRVPVEAADEASYSVGIVPQFDTRLTHSIWRPILDDLEQRTGVKFSLRGSTTIPDFEREFDKGLFDFVYMNPYHIIRANKQNGYRPLVRDIDRQLYGIVVVRDDSSIERVAQLDGQIVAFPAPNALGASLMSRAAFETEYGIKIRPKYVKTHSSVYLNVALGRAAAGGGVQKTLAQQPDELKNTLRVIYETSRVAPHPFAVHPRVPQPVSEQIKAALLAMGETESGKKMLALIPIKQIGSASLEDYEPLNQLGLDQYYQD